MKNEPNIFAIAIEDNQIIILRSALIISAILYCFDFHSETMLGFGIASFLALILRVFSLNDTNELMKYKKMGIVRILENRDEEIDYRSRIKKINKKLSIMGYTAKRLIEDFADIDSPREEKRVLLEKLTNRHIKIKILITDRDFVSENKKNHFDETLSKMKKIKQNFPNLEVKYYQHKPCHSIFLFDEECLIGPMFDNLESKDTPTIHAMKTSKFVQFYLKYFDTEWDKAESIDDKLDN